MKKFVIRLTIFYCSIYFMIVLAYAWMGEYVFDDTYKLPLELCLYILAAEHPKYNCQYARFLALNVFLTDSFSILDNAFNIVPDVTVYLSIVSASWIIAVIITIVLAVRHFYQYIKNRNNGIK